MLETINRLRSRPIAYRKKVAFWTAFSITLFIVVLWFVSLFVTFDGGEQADQSNTPAPASSFVRTMEKGFMSIREALTSW